MKKLILMLMLGLAIQAQAQKPVESVSQYTDGYDNKVLTVKYISTKGYNTFETFTFAPGKKKEFKAKRKELRARVVSSSTALKYRLKTRKR